MSVYYNEFDPEAAAWLNELMRDRQIAQGVVDRQDIRRFKPGELREFTQCHFFAGIGGWSRALRLAGWPDDKPVWTGSCPCQSFSTMGKQGGFDDDRHLWPEFFRLISECRPAQVFGEQVAAAIEHGWLDLVSSDLGKAGYEVGPAVFSALYVGAPHLRERLYFVADSSGVARPPQHKPLGDSMVEGFWSGAVWNDCPDGKRRAVEPRLHPLADGIPGQLALLRGAGNAIVPQQAADFIATYVEALTTIPNRAQN